MAAGGWAIIPAGLDLAAVAHVQAQLLADLHAIGQRSDRLLCQTEEDRHRWAEAEIAFAMT